MKNVNRRAFMAKAAAGLAGLSLLAPEILNAKTPSLAMDRIGFQGWIKRDEIGKDFPGTLKMMAGLGYNSIEMCSPPGYTSFGFGKLQNLKASEMKKIINDAGFTCVSCHYGFDESGR